MDINNATVGNRIKSIRLDKGATMEEFGKAFDTSKGTVNNWEKGRNLPNKENLLKIAKMGNMTVEQLLYGEHGRSHYNWDYIQNFLISAFNGLELDKGSFEKTQHIVDKAFFLNFGMEEIINIYMFQKNSSSPLESLEDLQDYFEQTSEGLSSYIDSVTGEALMDLEIQIAFSNQYAYRIKKYLETGIWTLGTISELKEKNPKQ
ncbi:helix-turn-helix transcriptional regulator [Streptococcus thoraltensis]|uniref:helix-turn-helix domain-containing protein n=1 Tax=Streptococcus thoraltensis TaxID=55085 RepID=UPI002A7EC4CF|nr:helix-turn-helix transcriptional regulator [Streptococcus thoraltensis]MDY4760726.1 helix-turn-helix transcriptional regulator [Streptococcus thoraltensis]HEM6117251.1 helix-turn-helix transcriptional regulator [Streptococcus suis]